MSTRKRKPPVKLSKDFFIDKHSTGILMNNNIINATIQLLHQNVQSLNNKKINIEVLLTDKTLESDVLCINEHWLAENYSLISKFCRKNKQHGGSCIYVKTNLEAKP
jgi:hypothetical protein